MKPTLIASGAVAAFLIATPAAYGATAAEELQSRQYLIGTWNCSYTVGPRGGTYTTTWAKALDNRWLKQSYNQPAAGGAPGFIAEYFIGYDEARRGWVRFGAMTTGQYFAIRMTDTPNAGWSWKYVSFFPRRRPETPGSDATFTKKSGIQYTVDGPTYPESGKLVTEHHICKKVR